MVIAQDEVYGDIRMQQIIYPPNKAGGYNYTCNLKGCGCSIMCTIFVLLALGGAYNLVRLIFG